MNIDFKNFDCICEECKNKLQSAGVWDFPAGKNGVICDGYGKRIEPGSKFFRNKEPMTVFVRQSID